MQRMLNSPVHWTIIVRAIPGFAFHSSANLRIFVFGEHDHARSCILPPSGLSEGISATSVTPTGPTVMRRVQRISESYLDLIRIKLSKILFLMAWEFVLALASLCHISEGPRLLLQGPVTIIERFFYYHF